MKILWARQKEKEAVQYGKRMQYMADLHILQSEVEKQMKDLGHSQDPKIIMLFLLEELGESTRAFLKENGYKENNNRIAESFRQELGDVFLLLLRLAAVTGTDLEHELAHTMGKISKASEEV